MSRRSGIADAWIWGAITAGGCVVVAAVVALFGTLAILTSNSINDGPTPEPEPSPTAQADTATPSDPPEEEEEAEVEALTPPEPPEEPAPPTEEEDDTGGRDDEDSSAQTGIQFGSDCAPVGALGIAVDGRPAECFMGHDGRARWGYDSDRG
ncbi:hypothetical protein Q8791_27095 [Nocardiopsis sp. CT-R113]|uniref:Uncharacterized protein n=1 Tax=Nocardiopsis codii TaxID=3065942 RepID=A0ABU7KFB2_9ACTN|nr:hypothetical protein [Nocardiopsis sp. CT-R113]MEE2040892.1 hypothetical protein [Nocardiopsis sp. CT-R113]